MVLAGQPRDATYAASVSAAFSTMMEEAAAAHFPAAMAKHRRGPFVAIHVGLAFDKVQRVPSRMDGGKYAPIVHRLLGNKHVRRMAGFANGKSPPVRAPLSYFIPSDLCTLGSQSARVLPGA